MERGKGTFKETNFMNEFIHMKNQIKDWFGKVLRFSES